MLSLIVESVSRREVGNVVVARRKVAGWRQGIEWGKVVPWGELAARWLKMNRVVSVVQIRTNGQIADVGST